MAEAGKPCRLAIDSGQLLLQLFGEDNLIGTEKGIKFVLCLLVKKLIRVLFLDPMTLNEKMNVNTGNVRN